MESPLRIHEIGPSKQPRGGVTVEVSGLVIPGGASIALIGPNGSGKSTLLEAALGLRPDYRRRVHLLGVELVDDARACFDRIGFAGQRQAYPEGLTVRDIFRLHRALRQGDAEPIFDTSEFERQSFAKLSTGQRRRVLLRTALDHAPELAILDEPDAGLDEDGLARLTATIRARARVGGTTIAATHDADVLSAADHVMVIELGRIAYAGPVQAFIAERIGAVTLEIAPPPSADPGAVATRLHGVPGVLNVARTKEGRIIATGGQRLADPYVDGPLAELAASSLRRATHARDVLTMVSAAQ